MNTSILRHIILIFFLAHLLIAKGQNEFVEVKRIVTTPGSTSGFGRFTAIYKDILVVGNPSESTDGYVRGNAYIYYRDQGGKDNWGLVKRLKASDAEDEDQFGWSIGISGDYVVVGAYAKNGGGAAYIFYRHQGGTDNWGELKKFTSSNVVDNVFFGGAVAIDGNNLLISGSVMGPTGNFPEHFFVYQKDEGGLNNWGEVKKVVVPSGSTLFRGSSISISGNDVIVGSPYENGTGIRRGAAYIYSKDIGGVNNWGLLKRITASDGADHDWFGSVVSLHGDVVLVSSISGLTNVGSGYIFYRNAGGADNWGEVKKIINEDSQIADMFGYSAHSTENYVAISAYRNNSQKGAIYLYYKDQGGIDNWGKIKTLTASDGETGDLFGASVSMTDEFVIGGATNKDHNHDHINDGAVYIFGPKREEPFIPNLIIPNLITVNNDSHNEYFVVEGGGQWELKIINRWGEIIYFNKDYKNDWGPDVENGIYFYHLRDLNGSSYSGWIHVLKNL